MKPTTVINLKGVYDQFGNITVTESGNIPIVVNISIQNNQRVAVVYINGDLAGQVTFGIQGTRAVNVFLNGFINETQNIKNIENIINCVS